MKRSILALLIIAAVGVGAGAYYLRHGGQEVAVTTAPITRGEIVDTVGATGTLQAVTTVQVGSQVSGNIQWLGADFNSIIKKGQVIARLDASLFQAQVDQARANYAKAQADVVQAQANLDRAKVTLLDAQQKYTRATELAERQLLPQADLDAAKTAADSAESALQSSQAALNSSKAVVGQAQANVNQAEVNLNHTVITSPIDGIVTQRSVDVGQTVAASLQAPTLFVLAADLTKMQINASIDEADVGRIRPGQRVTFRVDAYPTEQFVGNVTQVRLQPVVVSNVTTYGTIINVPNGDLRLKPGMTATLKVEVQQRADVLRVPNAALRFRPTTEIFAALNQSVPPEALGGGGRGGRGRGGQEAPAASPATPPAPAAAQQTPTKPSASAQQGAAPGVERGERPRGDFGGGGGFGRGGFGGGRDGRGGYGRYGGEGGGDGADRRAQLLERFKSLSSDEQAQFIERLKSRGVDTSAFKSAAKPASRPTASAPRSAETIDALFGPLPPVEARGRVWLYVNKTLKPVNLRVGITDGTYTELLSGELHQNMEVVTGVTGVGTTRSTPAAGAGGNPLLPQRGGFGGGGFGRGR